MYDYNRNYVCMVKNRGNRDIVINVCLVNDDAVLCLVVKLGLWDGMGGGDGKTWMNIVV